MRVFEHRKRCIADVIRQNYAHNSAMDSNPETSTKDKIINDQNGTTGKNFRYGNYTASHNGCEAIAIHNAMVLLGMRSSLSAVMRDCQDLHIMIGYGFFGTNPIGIGRVLRHYGIEYSRVGLSQMTQEGIYIISYWVNGSIFEGLHTVTVYYDGTEYTTYNCGSGQSTVNPRVYAKSYICGYYLGSGKQLNI